MQTFRQSFWKASQTPTLIIGVTVCAIATGFAIFSKNLWGNMAWFVLLFGICCMIFSLYVLADQYFYLILDEKSLTFQNDIKKSCKYKFLYQDIAFIHMGHSGGFTNAFIDVCLRGESVVRHFGIDMIPASSHAQIIALLREKGLEVRTTNLDNILQRQTPKGHPTP